MAPKATKAGSVGFCDSHYEVAEILSQLPDLVAKCEAARFINVFWGCKRRRTRTWKPTWLTAAMDEHGPVTSSPDTPLVFCRNRPEEKLKHIKRKPSQRRKGEDLSAEIVNLSLERESLMASSVVDEREKTHVDIETTNSAPETSDNPEDNQNIKRQQDHPPSRENQTAETSAQKSHDPSGQSNALPNLNLSPEEYRGMESWACQGIVVRSMSRMMAAEARQKRVMIRRVKSPIALRKAQCMSR